MSSRSCERSPAGRRFVAGHRAQHDVRDAGCRYGIFPWIERIRRISAGVVGSKTVAQTKTEAVRDVPPRRSGGEEKLT